MQSFLILGLAILFSVY